MTDLKSKFYNKYANLPLGSREEIVAVIDNEPITWKVARIEIDQGNEKGEKILEILEKLEIL